jgi:hypothetical protein
MISWSKCRPLIKELLCRRGFRHRWPLTPQGQLFKFAPEPSRARKTMHLFTNSIAALREAICRKSERLSALELSTEPAITATVKKIQTVYLQAGKRVGERKHPTHNVNHIYQPVINNEQEMGMER